ncbi:hypothetical protein [Ramlibacter sp.]|uniref:hypothetical protein n=1 Tax=Ramlibacter sp. TaxID=1917967 RepID=UPI003D0D0ACB
MKAALPALAALAASFLLSGCMTLVVGAAVTAADIAVGTAVGAVKLTGKVVGAAVDVVTPDSDDKK